MQSISLVPPTFAPEAPAFHFLPALREIAALVGEILEADLTGATEVSPSGSLHRMVAGLEPEAKPRSPDGEAAAADPATSVSGFAMAADQVIFTADLVTEGRFNDEYLRQLGVRSLVCVPLCRDGRPLGTLELYRLKVREFPRNATRLLRLVARQSAALIRSLSQAPAGWQERRGSLQLESSGAELRSSPRRHYPYCQRIAPVTSQRLPAKEEFFSVWCKDLSSGGFSLYLDSPPAFRHLVVALGPSPREKHLRAEVVHVQPVARDGRELYLVGCRFVDRV